ncbi:MAG TPA: hypothetical protein VIG36_14040 [Methylocystis sp.]|jgi:hypothetical protein
MGANADAATEQDRVELLPPPHAVTLNFGQQWNVVTPSVFRYEDKQWIDLFFETGALRLSTFNKFASYPDEFRGDRHGHEGFGVCYGETPENKSIVVAQRQGINALVFCCWHRLDSQLIKGFQRDSVFQIMNTVHFALEVSRQIAGFRHGLEGNCIYRDKLAINRKIDFELEKYKSPDGNIDMRAFMDAGQALGGPELVLLKTKQYQSQLEYRLLWEVDVTSGDYVDVIVPNARQYCRRVKDTEYTP